jgi:hypothetical protein
MFILMEEVDTNTLGKAQLLHAMHHLAQRLEALLLEKLEELELRKEKDRKRSKFCFCVAL